MNFRKKVIRKPVDSVHLQNNDNSVKKVKVSQWLCSLKKKKLKLTEKLQVLVTNI